MQVNACLNGVVAPDVDLVFKALADPTRRLLLDRLREQDGQTLGELCEHLDMARQSATQHLGVLEAANLISTRRQGRQKLHHLNVVPLHEIQERWIDRFERPRLRALSAIKQRAEEAMSDTKQDTQTYVYVTYIEASPEAVWEALTDPDATAAYWGHRNESDWQPGSTWQHVRNDGSGISDVAGTVVESDPPNRLVTTWAGADGNDPDVSTVTMDLKASGSVVKLTVTHEDLIPDHYRQISGGWPVVLSNLKSYLETGSPLPPDLWGL
ncbi:metalloregulator ArsR/SmtB family transcription factor [Aquihabitans sp. G128]|uniref:ArsR/SmtB family transcription factor n=1 Tax=Aquihabitans sp. G128 TaxID=2849779 RepID=UPI001C227A7F|nr:metalloregulator ArsR/SmtB family transcription factor [Aquihabitans sp. G128]QXC59915.1 metalloregulator ArsR/SmtB family transcription factor [Aquihabitans sp. G128]